MCIRDRTQANAHRLNPTDEHTHDLVVLEELLSQKPTEESVSALHGALAVVSSMGSVCELPAVTKFFNGNPVLGTAAGVSRRFPAAQAASVGPRSRRSSLRVGTT